MSTKTLRKRISLATAVALGAGVLSLVSVPSANATASASGGVAYASGTTGGLSTVAVGSSAICAASAYDGTALSLGAATTVTGSSDLVSLTIPVGSKISMLAAKSADVVKSSGTGIFLEDLTAATVTVNGTVFTAGADADSFFIVGNAVGTGYVKNYGAGTSALTVLTVNVVASCANTTWSDSKSAYEWDTAEQAVGSIAPTSSTYTYVNGDVAYLSIAGRDTYNSFLPAGTWFASTTGGCVIDIASSTGAAVGVLTSDAVTSTDGNGNYVALAQSVANVDKPIDCAVTVSYNGVTVISSTIKFTGDIVKLTVSSPVIGATGQTTYRAFTSVAYDSAGNLVAASPAVVPTTLNTYVTNVIAAANVATGTTTTGNGIVCGSTAGTATVKLYLENDAGDLVYSNEWTATCAGAAYTYTAALDKQSYKPGEIATLTITAKDIKGNLVYGAGAQGAGDTTVSATGWGRVNRLSATTVHAISGGSMDAVVAPALNDYFSNGVKTYQFKVGTTEGDFQMSVNLSEIATDTAKTVAYSVKSATTSVTMAEVLEAIVKLIASINKQIATLQKSLKKK